MGFVSLSFFRRNRGIAAKLAWKLSPTVHLSHDPNNSRQRGFPVDHQIQRWTRQRNTALLGTTLSRTTPPRQNEPVRAAARTMHPVSFDGVRRWLLDQRIHESLCFQAQRVVSQATNCCWRAPWAILPPCASRVDQCGRATSVEHARHHIISRAQASVRHPGKAPSHRHKRTPASSCRTPPLNTSVPSRRRGAAAPGASPSAPSTHAGSTALLFSHAGCLIQRRLLQNAHTSSRPHQCH